MRKLIIALVALFLLAVIAISGIALYEAHRFLNTPPETPGREVTVVIEPGTTFDAVSRMLAEKNLVTDAYYFAMYGKWKEAAGSIQAGEFTMNTGWLPSKILDTLRHGKPIMYKLALREGLTWWETAAVIENAGYANATEIEELVHDPDLLAKYDIPFESAEGFLFPDTYLLTREESQNPQFIVELLLRTFWQNAEKVWPDGKPDTETLKRVVILASVVEKETGAPEERGTIAGVYSKRLKRKMLLQADPTIIYGLGTEFDGNLTRRHLEDSDNPYNTYRHAGLPPGPICSPGLDALLAAADPEEHDYLFFVSKGDGTHQFSKNLRQHNNAVRKYQLRR